MSNAGSREQLQDLVDRLQGEVAELRRSRKRLVEDADANRRAIERALHDGAQQHAGADANRLTIELLVGGLEALAAQPNRGGVPRDGES